MILARYLGRRFLRSFVMISGVFLAILFLIDMVEQIRRFAGRDVGMADAAALAALNLPGAYYTILPLIVLLSGVALFLGLSRTSELVAIRASGRSALRMLAAPVVVALGLGVLAVMVLNPLVAASGKRYDESAAALGRGGAQTVGLSDGALWLRQGLSDAEAALPPENGGQVVIRAGRANPEGTTLYDASFLIFDASLGPTRRIEAHEAKLTPGTWQLTGVKEWPLDAENPELSARTQDSMTLPSDLTADRIREGFGDPAAVPVWQLPAFIAGLEAAGFSALRHRVWLQTELARPLMLAAMLVIAAAFTMRHMRGRSAGVLVLLSLAGGLALFFLANMAQVMGDNGLIPPMLAAWGPPVVALMFALGYLLAMEDG